MQVSACLLQTTTVTNTGNTVIDLLLSGTNMTAGGGANPIVPTNQKYATSSFTYSSCTICQTLSTVASRLVLGLAKATATSSVPTSTVRWGLFVPLGSWGVTYTGQNTFTAALPL